MRFGKFKRNQRGALVLIGLIVLSLVVLTYLTDYLRATQAMPYTTFLKQVEAGAVKSAYLDGDELRGQLHDGSRYQTVVVHDAALVAALQNHNVSLESVPASNQAMPWYMILLFIIIAVGVVAWVLLRQTRSGGSGGGNSPFGVGKSKAKMFMPSQIKITFDDVAGAQEAKEELRDLVDFLKFPEKYEKLGARLTKGVLLVGEPGNGKTLLAKAVAGEAHCPFFSVSGSDFIEVFVGVGAARVRDLFAQARKHAPAIIFIDEIDAVGRQRGGTFGGSHEERDQTLNQLLTEMDGFESDNAAVVVIAATNRPDVLDKALLRPGRFDKRVEVPYPDLASREQILQVHTRNVRMAAGIDLYKVARATPGFSGADLAQLINEAAIAAAKRNSRAVELKDLEEARDRMMLGKQTGSIIMSEKERKVTAYHEAGHALVTLLLPEVTDPLHKVTIIPRGRALGVTH
jgi:cell division protease FtsH